MNILAETIDFYKKIDKDLYKDLSAYLAYGYIHKTPESLILAKIVNTESEIHPVKQWNITNGNAWFVQTAIGENWISDWIKLMPFPLPKVGWMRALKNKPVKFWDLETILKRR